MGNGLLSLSHRCPVYKTIEQTNKQTQHNTIQHITNNDIVETGVDVVGEKRAVCVVCTATQLTYISYGTQKIKLYKRKSHEGISRLLFVSQKHLQLTTHLLCIYLVWQRGLKYMFRCVFLFIFGTRLNANFGS